MEGFEGLTGVYRGTTRVLQEGYMDVIRVLHRCDRGVTGLLKICYRAQKGVFTMI